MERSRILIGPVGVFALVPAGTSLSSAPRQEPDLKELAMMRITVDRRAFQAAERTLMSPPGSATTHSRSAEVAQIADWSRRWMEATLDLAETHETRAKAIEAQIERLLDWSGRLRGLVEGAGSGLTETDLDLFEYPIAEAKAELLKEGRPTR